MQRSLHDAKLHAWDSLGTTLRCTHGRSSPWQQTAQTKPSPLQDSHPVFKWRKTQLLCWKLYPLLQRCLINQNVFYVIVWYHDYELAGNACDPLRLSLVHFFLRIGFYCPKLTFFFSFNRPVDATTTAYFWYVDVMTIKKGVPTTVCKHVYSDMICTSFLH